MDQAFILLEKLLDKLGMTATQAWPFLVRYVWMQALVGTVTGAALLAAGAVLVAYFIKAGKSQWDDSYMFLVVLATVMCLVFGPICLAANFPDLLEPTGAAIHEVLKHAGASK